MARTAPPVQPEEVIPFGDSVAKESPAHQAILEQLRPFYPQIRRVQNSVTQKVSYEYAFSFSDPEGFWSVPSPKLYHPVTGLLDRYGYFGVLYTPTISKFWSFTTQPLISEAEEEDSQAQAEKPAARAMDSLVKPAVPSRCSEKEMEFLLSSSPFADWKTQVHGQPEGRFSLLTQTFFLQPPV